METKKKLSLGQLRNHILLLIDKIQTKVMSTCDYVTDEEFEELKMSVRKVRKEIWKVGQ